jgi:membrane-associated phospholipid phosphatase
LYRLRSYQHGGSEQQKMRSRGFVHGYATLIFVIAVAFVALAIQAHSRDLLQPDLTVARAVQQIHDPLYSWILTHVSDFGFFPGNLISYVTVFGGLLILGLRLGAALALGSSLLASLAGSALRASIARPRPLDSQVHVVTHIAGFGFPSGHVIQYSTLFGFAFYLVLIAAKSGLSRNVVLVVLLLLVILVGPSRVYLGAHWPSDVVGAYFFSALWLALTVELYLVLTRRPGSIMRYRPESPLEPHGR